MKVKIFTNTDPDRAEAAINEWLEANEEIELEQVTQTQALSEGKDGYLLTISIFYSREREEQARRGFE